jgi:hypothetical protein
MYRVMMRSIVAGFLLFVCAKTAVADPTQYALRSSTLQVTIDLGSGAVTELRDLARPSSPLVFTAGEDVLKLAAGDFRPAAFASSNEASNSVTLTSAEFQHLGDALPLRTTITYRLLRNRLSVRYCFEAAGRVALDNGLQVDISSAVWDTIFVRNHFSGEDPVVLSRSNPVRYLALNQVYEFHNAIRRMTLVYANPYHSLVTISPAGSHAFRFRWHSLVATAPLQAVEPKGPPFASVLSPGVRLYRQVDLIIDHASDAPPPIASPLAYFSPWPNGCDQMITMTFDDIPFGRWIFPVSGHDPNAPMEQYLIRLLEDHPKMKMGWIVLPDEILNADELLTPDYPPGKWWLAHGKRRMLTNAPPAYLQWLRNIDRDSLVYGYEHRVRLGSHGYHHTPEMLFGNNFEFQSYDTLVSDSTFATVAREFSLLGLHASSRRWIRFPGFCFARSAIESLIKFGYVFFDYWGMYDKLPWMQFYSDHGRIWGAGTMWTGDTPSTYDVMDKILRAGKLCHTSGHPHVWFDGDPEAAYAQISQEFSQAESNFPNLGYLFPFEVGDLADETSDIHDIETDAVCDALVISFSGSATLGETLILEWPADRSLPNGVIVDGAPAPRVETRGRRVVITLPALAEGRHVVWVSADLCGSYEITFLGQQPPPSAVYLSQNHPNPFNPQTTIDYGLPSAAHVTIAVYTASGERVAVLVDDDRAPGTYAAQWDGRDRLGRPVASGIYFCRLDAGADSRVRKLVLMR